MAIARVAKRLATALVAGLALAGAVTASAAGPRPPRTPLGLAPDRPNVVVLVTDAQTVAELGSMPNTLNLLAAQGATFDNSFVSFAASAPSLATLLTGQYPHDHGVRGDAAPNGGYYRLDGRETLPVWLQRVGYQTIEIGRYLNGYGIRNPREVPPGWNQWHATIDPSTYNYWGYTLNENGAPVRYGTTRPPFDPAKYLTDVEAAKAVDAIRVEAARPGPFYLQVAFLAPHAGGPAMRGDPRRIGTAEPPPRYRGRFAATPLPLPASFNEADVSDKPAAIRSRKPFSRALVAEMATSYQHELESLLAVDDAVGQIVAALEQTGQLADTDIIFTSDSGALHGEHRIAAGRGLPYEPSIRVPLVIRGPGIPAGLHLHQNVSNVDLAPTIVDLTGATPGRVLDGTSLLPLLADPTIRLGRDLLVEGPSGGSGFSAIRTNRYLYVEYGTGERELYDVLADPDELQSRQADPALAGIETSLAQRLAALLLCSGPSCRRPPSLAVVLNTLGNRDRGGPRCRAARLQVLVRGDDRGKVARIATYVDGRRVIRDRRFSVAKARLRAGSASLVRVRVVLGDGRAVTIDRRVAGCSRR
jgi:arylsulfatase A-like enzyme